MTEQENKPQGAKLGRLFKLGLSISLVLGIIFIGIISINLDSLREPIMDELSQITDLSIEIESLNLSFSSGLSLRGGGLKVSSKDGSKQIFSAENLFLDAELKPLLKRQLKIRKIILVKPEMNINFGLKPDSVVLPNTSITEKTPDQEVLLQSRKTESLDLVKEPQSKRDVMESISKLLKSQDLSLRTFEIKSAVFQLHLPGQKMLPAKKISALVNARFELYSPNSNEFNIEGKLSRVEIKGITFIGTLQAKDLLAKHIPINVDIESASLPITKINTLIKELASAGIIPVKIKSGQLEKMSIRLNGLIDPSDNPFNDIVIKNEIRISNLEISIPGGKKNYSVPLPHLAGQGIWKKNILNYKIDGMLMDGSFQSSLVVNLPDAMKGSFSGTLSSETKLEGLSLSSIKFELPDKWTPITGTANGFMKTQGSVGEPSSNLRKHGRLNINNLSLGSETPTTVKKTTLKFQQKAQQFLTRVQIKDALFNNISIKTIGAKLKFSNEKVSLTNGRMMPSQGAILFSGDYRPRSNTYIIRINGKKLRIEDFMTEQIEGSLLFSSMFQGHLNTAQKIRQQGEEVLFRHVASNLSGKLSIQLKKGRIRPTPMIKKFLPYFNLESAGTPQNKGFSYEVLGGDLKIWNGNAVTENFELKGPQLNLTALAAANLDTGKLDGEIKMMPMQLFGSITNAVPVLGNLLSKEVTEALSETYFRLGGTLKKPELVLEEDKTLFGKPASMLEELIKTTEVND